MIAQESVSLSICSLSLCLGGSRCLCGELFLSHFFTTETPRLHRDTEKNHHQVSAIVLNVKPAFNSPLLEIEAPPHAAKQTSHECLAGARERTAYRPVAATKQAPTDRFKKGIVMAAAAKKLRLIEK